MTLRISSCVIDIMQRDAAAATPREACGLLFGSADAVTSCENTANVAAEPTRHFEIDPVALFAALRAERGGGRQLVGYWHSHPGGEARPSATDIAMAAGDGKLWVIVAGAAIGAWRSTRDGFVAVAIDQSAAGPT